MTAPTLHDYQKVAVEHLLRNPRAGLFLEAGLGKTAIVLRTLRPENLPVLVTAPKRVAENVWAEEAGIWRPDLRIVIAAGDPKTRARALASGADIVVIGRDNLADAVPLASSFRTFVIDELSGFKTRGTNRWKSARALCKDREYVWGLTGSPTPNGLMDLWAELFLLDRGERLGRTLTAYRGRFFYAGQQLPNGVVTDWILRPEAPAAIYGLVEDICLSMEAAGKLDLPPVRINHIKVPLAPQVKAAYKKMKQDLVVDLEVLEGVIHTAQNAAVLSSKLSQMTAGFMYHDDADIAPEQTYDVLHRDKVRAAEEIYEGTGSPIMVFYRFRAEAELLREVFKDKAYGPDTPDLQKRWNDGELPILLSHPQSISHGLNLQKGPGHTVLWASLTWSLEDWEQANARLPRQGQANPVTIHVLESPGTIDLAMWEAVMGKKTVQKALMDHLESPL